MDGAAHFAGLARQRGAQGPRAAGEREARWVHLLCGPVAVNAAAPDVASSDDLSLADLSSLRSQQTLLVEEIARLRRHLNQLAEALGVDLGTE